MLRFARIALALMLATLAGCGGQGTPPSDAPDAAHVPPPPDVGDIAHYNGCKSLPTRALSPYETCLVDRLKAAACTPAADCVLTCLASPDGTEVGGGCDHVCFGYNVRHQWKDRPNAMDECPGR
ncbi:hypothetical protein LYSHEL_26740 [Lysobacter helvus]|uniref:Lipoprotein n=2 Tax=Lysobacteraceae TaxID=32033 RepID=A0ABN6FVD3_9GAMM|nr:hypothetical protein LYSCAS_26720 [Lysobacter caseinilyticus]BCT96803.1 hypothetical protein LYSHEL_26740 [Lysobacter helvus]